MNLPLRSIAALVAVLGAVPALAVAAPRPTAAPHGGLPVRATVPPPAPTPLLPAVPKVAPGYQAPSVAPTSADIVGVTAQPFVALTLPDAIGMALLKNPNLAVSSANRRVASYQVVQVKGAFDVRFEIEPSVSHAIAPPQNPFFAGPGYGNIVTNTQSLSGGLSGVTVNGSTYDVTLSQSRQDNNEVFNGFNPAYPTALSVSLTQPLLKDAGMNDLKRQYKLAIVGADTSTQATLVDASNTIAQVEDAYWDLVAAWRNVAIQEDALRQAIAQQQSNVRLAKRGAAAPIDAVESSTQVANFQDDVFSALQSVATLQNTLKSEIVDNPGDPIWRANIVPTSPVLQLPKAPSLPTLVADAMRSRPEVREAEDAVAQAQIAAAYAKNQSLPQVDLQANYTTNGFAGYPNVFGPPFNALTGGLTPPAYTQGGMAQSYNTLWNFKFPAYSVGLVLTQPIGAHTAKGLRGQARQEARIAAVEMRGTRQRIVFEARNALQSYQSALARLYAARQARIAAEAVYASELRKFHDGASTTFLVLQRQVELDQDRGRELQAQTDLNKAVVELERTSGAILKDNGVDLQHLGAQALGRPAGASKE